MVKKSGKVWKLLIANEKNPYDFGIFLFRITTVELLNFCYICPFMNIFGTLDLFRLARKIQDYLSKMCEICLY